MQQPMGGQSPLDQLKDIHLPETISWWPLAFGWWIVLVLVIVAIAALTTFFIKRHNQRKYRRQALVELEQITSRNLANAEACEALSQLIRRTIRASDYTETIQSDSLNDMLKPHLTDIQITWITSGKYQADAEAPDASQMADAIKTWIKGHKL